MSKKFIEYPIALSYAEAIDHLAKGGELWMEQDNEPGDDCTQIEDVHDLNEVCGLDSCDVDVDERDRVIRDANIHIIDIKIR